MNFADNSWSCQRLLFEGCNISPAKQTDFGAGTDHDPDPGVHWLQVNMVVAYMSLPLELTATTEFWSLRDRPRVNSTKFAVWAALSPVAWPSPTTGQKTGFSVAILPKVDRSGWNLSGICCCTEYTCWMDQFYPDRCMGGSRPIENILLHCALAVAQCIVIGTVCLCVGVCVGGSVTTINRNCVHRFSPKPVWWGSMHAISSYRGNRPTPPVRPPVANTQTGPITIHCTAKLSAQCNETRSSADADKPARRI